MEKDIKIIGDINVPITDLFNKEEFIVDKCEGSEIYVIRRKDTKAE